MTGIIFIITAVISAKYPFQLVLAILLHEVGHVLFAVLCKLGFPRIEMSPAGIKLSYGGVISYRDNIFLCLSGCITSFILFFAVRGTAFSLYSLGLGVINLLPISILDGGGALRSYCFLKLPYEKALTVTRKISVTFVILLLLFNILIQLKIGVNITLLAVSIYTAVTVLTE